MLNLFYEEPDPDRWIKYDRYPRRIIRRILRGKQRPGGVAMVVINLMKGLDMIGVPYRLNDYDYIKKHPKEIACIIGKPHVFFEREWENPVIFGAGVYSHPIEYPHLLEEHHNIKRFLVPGDWMKNMFTPYYGDKVLAWPVGTDTNEWSPALKGKPQFDFLIYDKIRWDHDDFKRDMINPICKILDERSLSYQFITYGSYTHDELKTKIKFSKSVLFLCEHETQGLAYQQVLSTGTPILAWEKGGYWVDPYYYPDKVKFQPVSAVPYWDNRCGMKFNSLNDFESQLSIFSNTVNLFKPREYILENLTLEKCAEAYLSIYEQVRTQL